MTDQLPPVFSRLDDGAWMPSPFARGPFDGLQGGAVAGLMSAEAEAALGPGFQPVGITAHYLRPCPIAPLSVLCSVVQQGRRTATMEVTLSTQGKICSRAVVSFIAPIAAPAVPEPPPSPFDTSTLAMRERRRARHGVPWLMDVMEAGLAPDGAYWFRMKAPITGSESALARALAPVDWVVGLSRPDSFEQPVVAACPNLDLSVHFDRMPDTAWIGVQPVGRWRRNGIGVAHGRISDKEGACGEVSASVVLVP